MFNKHSCKGSIDFLSHKTIILIDVPQVLLRLWFFVNSVPNTSCRRSGLRPRKAKAAKVWVANKSTLKHCLSYPS